MPNKLLYFPYINIPKANWTFQSILYWDEVGAIVPHSFINTPNQLSDDMHALVKSGLVNQVFPENYIYRIYNFDNLFLALLQNPNFNMAERRERFKNGKVSKLHADKFSYLIFKELQRAKIAAKGPENWYFVESRTARLFMMYLATLLSQEANFTPGTDKTKYIDDSISQDGVRARTNKIRGRLLKDLMPYSINPDLHKLRRFKEKHHRELTSFRSKLEQTIFELSHSKKKQLRQELYDLKLQEINAYRDEMYARLTESKIGKVVFGSLFGVITTISGVAAESNTLQVIGVANALYSGLSNLADTPVLRQDFSYLALIDKHFMPNHYDAQFLISKKRG